jgi:hypothetical protein
MKTRRICAVLDAAMGRTLQPQHLVERIVTTGITRGLEWDEIVLAVDEAERRTGLALHPISPRTGQP